MQQYTPAGKPVKLARQTNIPLLAKHHHQLCKQQFYSVLILKSAVTPAIAIKLYQAKSVIQEETIWLRS